MGELLNRPEQIHYLSCYIIHGAKGYTLENSQPVHPKWKPLFLSFLLWSERYANVLFLWFIGLLKLITWQPA